MAEVLKKNVVTQTLICISIAIALITLLLPTYFSFVDVSSAGGVHHSVTQTLFKNQIAVDPQATFSNLLLTNITSAVIIVLLKLFVVLFLGFVVAYFRFPLKILSFIIFFILLLLPVQIEFLPKFHFAWQPLLIDSFTGLMLPILGFAVAALLFRQFFLLDSEALHDTVRMDGVGMWHFFWDIYLPLSVMTFLGLFVVTLIYAWNQLLQFFIEASGMSTSSFIESLQPFTFIMSKVPVWGEWLFVAVLAFLPMLFVVLMMQLVVIRRQAND